MYLVLMFFMFFQTTAAPLSGSLATPLGKTITLVEAEQYVKKKSDVLTEAQKQKVVWTEQVTSRTIIKQEAIDMVKKKYNLDATWTWDDATSKFVKK